MSESSELSDYLVYAALNNPGLQAAFENWKAAMEQVPQVGSLPDPRFSYQYFIHAMETRQIFQMSQMLPWFGKLDIRQDAASAEAETSRQAYEKEKLDLFYRVKYAFYEYYYLGRAMEIARENLLLLRSLEETTRIKYQAGSVSRAALTGFQVEISKLEDRLKTLQDVQRPAVARLNALLNRPPNAPLPLPKSLPADYEIFLFGREEIDQQDLTERLKKNNPDLEGLEAQIEKSKHEMALARKEYYPDLELGVMLMDARETAMNERGRDPIGIMAGINLPLYRGKYRAGERQATARYHQSIDQRAERQNMLLAELQMTLFEYRDAGRKIQLYQNTLIQQIEELLANTRQAFAVDQAQYLDIIDALRSLLEIHLLFERAAVDRYQKLAEIEMLIGYSSIRHP